MSKFSFAGVSAYDRECTLGREFRNIDVLDLEIKEDGVWITRVILQNHVHALIGHPSQALARYTEAFVGGLA
ncbi:hypothetical protein CURE108131_23090 [Cupriavidus respiraculi]|uniref:Transposase IS200-like domain-containing protein n=1 Tax=Cupriavidus respiraculi TaxID=195930 RepID=A0ABM8WY07_9BURK|nr:hypothetical protein [Cupriavidus respiraculi]CAG9172447.1 hypothetical protein LMG21510_01977 [Cupriavidus respiraculi]